MKAADLQHRSTLPLLVKLLVDNQLPAALVGHCHAERSEASRQFVGRPLGNESNCRDSSPRQVGAQNDRRRSGAGDIVLPCRRLVRCSVAEAKNGRIHPEKTVGTYAPPAGQGCSMKALTLRSTRYNRRYAAGRISLSRIRDGPDDRQRPFWVWNGSDEMHRPTTSRGGRRTVRSGGAKRMPPQPAVRCRRPGLAVCRPS